MSEQHSSKQIAEDIVRLRRRIKKSQLPNKISDYNLLIGSWNIRNFGRVYDEWSENNGSPKRNLRSLAYISEIVKRFDVIAIQREGPIWIGPGLPRDRTRLRRLSALALSNTA